MQKWMLCMLGCVLLTGCSKPVEKHAEGTHTNEKGDKITASVDFKDDKIEKVVLDEIAAGETESKKAAKDAYGMKEASSIQKEWYEQIAFLETYIAEHGVDGISLDKNGKAENNDVKSGCTISIKGFLEAVEEAEEHAEENVK